MKPQPAARGTRNPSHKASACIVRSSQEFPAERSERIARDDRRGVSNGVKTWRSCHVAPRSSHGELVAADHEGGLVALAAVALLAGCATDVKRLDRSEGEPPES